MSENKDDIIIENEKNNIIDLNEEEEEKEKKPEFYMSQKSFFLTFPHCDLNKYKVYTRYILRWEPNFLAVAREKHKDGDYHIHIWIELKKRITIEDPRFFDIHGYHCNIGKMKDEKRSSRATVLQYLTKEDKEILIFEKQADLDSYITKKNKRKRIAKELMSGTKLSDIMRIFPEEMYHYDKLKTNISLYFNDINKIDKIIPRKCFWIYGPPRVGKSYIVRDTFEYVYEKDNTIWWDGYSNEDIVILDDFDKSWFRMLHKLKIWADNYRFNAQIKGGNIKPIYTKLIVTSNYSITDIMYRYGPDDPLEEAIRSRFKEIYFNEKEKYEEIKKEIQ